MNNSLKNTIHKIVCNFGHSNHCGMFRNRRKSDGVVPVRSRTLLLTQDEECANLHLIKIASKYLTTPFEPIHSEWILSRGFHLLRCDFFACFCLLSDWYFRCISGKMIILFAKSVQVIPMESSTGRRVQFSAPETGKSIIVTVTGLLILLPCSVPCSVPNRCTCSHGYSLLTNLSSSWLQMVNTNNTYLTLVQLVCELLCCYSETKNIYLFATNILFLEFRYTVSNIFGHT